MVQQPVREVVIDSTDESDNDEMFIVEEESADDDRTMNSGKLTRELENTVTELTS